MMVPAPDGRCAAALRLPQCAPSRRPSRLLLLLLSLLLRVRFYPHTAAVYA